ncbi:hypothetical protein [Chryseobacterium sp. ERMR1:04]|uniref:bacteriocin-like protein n=1 Tax=Chryseobacterium sp. ERMR1:04 TaxID=1705393 RepID=UPI000A908E92|nr:hypothetical protein [Chryseobacterium sp. ERMR1:04]
MKNLKKLNRENLRSINGGALSSSCVVDLDCGPTGCAVCTTVGTRKRCLYFFDTDISLGCQSLYP